MIIVFGLFLIYLVVVRPFKQVLMNAVVMLYELLLMAVQTQLFNFTGNTSLEARNTYSWYIMNTICWTLCAIMGIIVVQAFVDLRNRVYKQRHGVKYS